MSKNFIDPVGQPFEFPDSVLKILSEVTNGNFLLFFSNNGEPDVRAEFMDSINEIALRSYCTTFVGGINNAENIASTQQFLGMDGHDDDCEHFEDEEEE